MEQMRDSTALADDPEGLRREIAGEGYALVRGLVDAGAARTVAGEMRQTLARHGWLSLNGGRHETVLRVAPPGQEPEDYWQPYGEVLGLESMNALPWRSALRGVMTRVLGPGTFTYPLKAPRMVFPDQMGGRPTPLHRDNRRGPLTCDMITTWVALDDIPAELGGVAILRTSQTYRYGPIPEDDTPVKYDAALPIPGDESPDWVTAEFRAGDVLMFHSYTVHRGLPNRSGRMRLSADYRWQRADHTVHVSALLPYRYLETYPEIPGWSTLTKEWSDPSWCGYPEGLNISEVKWPAEADDRVPASELVPLVPGARESWPARMRDPGIIPPYELPDPY